MEFKSLVPSFHDGHLTGLVSREGEDVVLRVADVNDVEYEIVLGGVKKLRVNDYREGNIILSIQIGSGPATNAPLEDEVLEGVSPETRQSAYYRDHAAALARGDQLLFLLQPSYGASVKALCRHCEVNKLA